MLLAFRMTSANSAWSARSKAFRAMAFSAGDHFSSRIMVEGASVSGRGKLAMVSSSRPAFYAQSAGRGRDFEADSFAAYICRDPSSSIVDGRGAPRSIGLCRSEEGRVGKKLRADTVA